MYIYIYFFFQEESEFITYMARDSGLGSNKSIARSFFWEKVSFQVNLKLDM